MTRQPDYPFVLVVWDDAKVNHDSIKAEDIDNNPARYQTYGWLVAESEKAVSIAAEWCPKDAEFRGITTVTMAMVVEIMYLALAKKRKKVAQAPVAEGSAGA